MARTELLTSRPTAQLSEVLVDDILSQPHLPLYYAGRFLKVIPYGKQAERSLSQGCPRWALSSFLTEMITLQEKLQIALDRFEIEDETWVPTILPLASFLLEEESVNQLFIKPVSWVEQMKCECFLPGWRQALTTLRQWVTPWKPSRRQESQLPIWLAKTLVEKFPHYHFRLSLLVGEGEDINYWAFQNGLKGSRGRPRLV